MNKLKKPATQNALLICSFCGETTAEKKLMPQAFGHGVTLVVVENVPTVFCRNCGESYFEGDTLKELDRILLNRKTATKKRSIAVAEFV